VAQNKPDYLLFVRLFHLADLKMPLISCYIVVSCFSDCC